MSSIADAVVAAVQAAVPGRQVLDGIVQTLPDAATGYMSVHCPPGETQFGNVALAVDGKLVKVQLNSFGPTRQAAEWLSVRAVDYLLANGVTVSGWGHGVVFEHYDNPPIADEDVKQFPLVQIHDELHMLFAKDN